MHKKNGHPPKLAQRLLLSFLREDLSDEVLGDLEEKFYKTSNRASLFKAKLNYWHQVVNYARPFAVRKLKSTPSNNIAMFQSYFKIGWRNVFKEKGYSLINIGGLAAGMAVAVLIGLWIYDELSFNKYHKNYDSIARVMYRASRNGETGHSDHMPFPLGQALAQSFQNDFEYVVMSTFTEGHIISNGDSKFTKLGNYMQPDAPKMLTLDMIGGTHEALKEMNSIMLSESFAKTLFGDEDPMNKVVKIDNKADAKITGLYKDLPKNSEFHEVAFIAPLDLYLASNDWLKRFVDVWNSGNIEILVQLAPHAKLDDVSRKIVNVIHDHVPEGDKVYNIQTFLHPMSKWHLYEEFKDGRNAGGQVRFVWLFGTIGIFVLLLACINFMNLSTARSERRAKEVGIRKAIGSFRSQLMSQFFSESLLVVILAFTCSIGIVWLALPWFNEIANKQIVMPWTSQLFWISCTAFVVLTGAIAGSYPALYLSSFQPVKVLKGAFRAGRFASVPRKVLVVMQFTVSVTLIIGTMIVFQQIQYTKNRPVGYSREGLIFLNMKTNEVHDHFDVVRNELIASGTVLEIAESNVSVVSTGSNNGGVEWRGKKPGYLDNFNMDWVSPEYGKAVGWQFTAGRDFSRAIANDKNGIVINESAVKYMGLDNPIGEVVRWENRDWTILGVVKDMVVGSPFQATRQRIYLPLGWPGNVVSLRLSPERSTHEALATIQSTFKQHVPGMPFDYYFADEQFAKKFNNEVRVGKLASVFATLAIFISCLGLFGLASFVAEQRTKEIGIRKIVGASVYNLWGMLSKDFVVLVLISCVIAIPLSYYYLNDWLQQYEYRTEISWWIFGVTVVGALLITLMTVSFQAIKAAMMNPVKSLRSE